MPTFHDRCHGGKLVRPGDAEWEHAKWVFKTTAFTGDLLFTAIAAVALLAVFANDVREGSCFDGIDGTFVVTSNDDE
eukprot:SAG11_NODE_12458_length_702_cov_1.122720_1_plen_77_part_00